MRLILRLVKLAQEVGLAEVSRLSLIEFLVTVTLIFLVATALGAAEAEVLVED
jgi:hypothetical protein